MKRRRTLALLALAMAGALPAHAQRRLLLRDARIVVLVPTVEEQQAGLQDAERQARSQEFLAQARAMAQQLAAYRSQFDIVYASPNTVEFPGTRHRPVVRQRLKAGWAYVFYRPDAAPVVIEGAASATQLVCTARRVFELKGDTLPPCPPL
jgi:hypothetical protein